MRFWAVLGKEAKNGNSLFDKMLAPASYYRSSRSIIVPIARAATEKVIMPNK